MQHVAKTHRPNQAKHRSLFKKKRKKKKRPYSQVQVSWPIRPIISLHKILNVTLNKSFQLLQQFKLASPSPTATQTATTANFPITAPWQTCIPHIASLLPWGVAQMLKWRPYIFLARSSYASRSYIPMRTEPFQPARQSP